MEEKSIDEISDEESMLSKAFKEQELLFSLLNLDCAYPGNIKGNIQVYNNFCKLYPDVSLDKATFLKLVLLYREKGSIHSAFCVVCGKLCKPKCGSEFNSTCSKKCGRILAGISTSKSYAKKSLAEKQAIKDKRMQTNLERFGTTTNLNSEACLETRREKFDGSISPFNKKEIRDAVADNNKAKHGGLANSFQWKSTKDKIKQTKFERYKDETYTNIEQAKRTNLEKYGVTSYLATNTCRETSKAKAMEMYGVEYFNQAEEVKEKIRATSMTRYGCEYYTQTEEFKEKSRKTCMELYGVEWNCMRKEARDTSKAKSKINAQWKEFLEAENEEIGIKDKSYDLLCNGILVEINPTITHNSTISIFKNDKPKATTYHRNKTVLANSMGYRCIHVWDWDEPAKIKMLVSNKQKLYARKLQIANVSKEQCNTFLNTYHIQDTCNGQIVRLGLYRDNELIELMTFGKARYSKKYEWELLRLCTKAGYKVVGGSARLFKHFINTYNPNSIVSYCDKSKFSGDVYVSLGMTLDVWNKPGKHWYNPKTQRHITNNLLLRTGYSVLHGDTTHAKGENNKELMLNNGYLEIYDCGQATYSWTKSSHVS